MTEIEIIKLLFWASTVKERITVNLNDGHNYTGKVRSFDGEIVLLDETGIALSSITSVVKEHAIQEQQMTKENGMRDKTTFLSSLISGNKDDVEQYFDNPQMLIDEGYSDEEADEICSNKTKPLPWNDDERNSEYNQARRVYEVLGTKDDIAQHYFEHFITTSTSTKLCKKAVGGLLEIYCIKYPKLLPDFWDKYKETIVQDNYWSLKLARAFVSINEYQKLMDLLNNVPTTFDMHEVLFIYNFCKRYGTFNISPNPLETAIIAGDIPQLRLLALDADTLVTFGYSTTEIKQIQDALQLNINFAVQDDLSIAKRLVGFQGNKNHLAERFYISVMQSGKKLVYAAQGLLSIYAQESRHEELQFIFEKYLISTWAQHGKESGEIYFSSLYQCGDFPKALSFWMANAETLQIDTVKVLYMLLKMEATDDEIKECVKTPIKLSQANITAAKSVIDLLLNRSRSDTINAYLMDIYNSAFGIMDIASLLDIKARVENSEDVDSHSTMGVGLFALKNGFSADNPILPWFIDIVPKYLKHELIGVVRNIISVYVDNGLAHHSDIGDLIHYIQNLGEDIPKDLLAYLKPAFTNTKERDEWLNHCITNAQEVDSAVFELFCEVVDETSNIEKLHKFIIELTKYNVTYNDKVIEKAIHVLDLEVSTETNKNAVNEMINCILSLSASKQLSIQALIALYHAFCFVERDSEAYILKTILNSKENAEILTQNSTALRYEEQDNLSLFGIISNTLSAEDISKIDRLINIWGQYFQITENDTVKLSEIRDYYNSPEKWTAEAKESLCKHLFRNSTTPLYWQLISIANSESDVAVKTNIQFHRTILEKGSLSSVLETSIDNGLNSYTIDILKHMLSEKNLDEFIRQSDYIIRIIDKHPELLNIKITTTLLETLNKNVVLRTDIKAWECVLDVAMKIAFVGNAVEFFSEKFSPYLSTSYPESNCRFLCNLLLHMPEKKELILTVFEEIQKSAQSSVLIQILVDMLSSTKVDDLTNIQRDVLKIITMCKKNIDEATLYKYYAFSISEESTAHVLAVFDYLERYMPKLGVFSDVKKYELMRAETSDDEILSLYVSEYDSLNTIVKPERVAKSIINLIPGELYLKAKGYEVQSAIDFGKKVLNGYHIKEINYRNDLFKSLDQIFNVEKYPNLALCFMRCCFTRRWNSLILYSVEDTFINDILKNDTTVKTLLFKKSYEVLKSAINTLLDLAPDDSKIEAMIIRVDVLFAACSGIKRSKNYLRRIFQMDNVDRATLEKIFTLRIESKTLRNLGLIGAAILAIPGNEKVAFLVGMLETKNLAELFNNNECVNTLSSMPKENAILISEIYTTFFYKDADSLFRRFLQNQSDNNMIEFIQNTDADVPDTFRVLRAKYLEAKNTVASSGNPVPKSVAKKYELIKAEYLYTIIKDDCQAELQMLAPSPMDYLSVITWLFNKRTSEDIKSYIWKLDVSILMPCLAHIMTLLGQYPQAYAVAKIISDNAWKNASLQVLYRSVAFNVTCNEDREIKRELSLQAYGDSDFFIGKFIPINEQQRPLYMEKMLALCAFADELLKYMMFNGLNISWASVDLERFKKSIAFYSRENHVSEMQLSSAVLPTSGSIHDSIVALLNSDYLSNLVLRSKPVLDDKLQTDVVPDISLCAGILRYLSEKSNETITRDDFFSARNLVRWIHLLRMEESGFSREAFILIMNLITDEDIVYKVQWNYILTSLYRYFENIESLQNLVRIVELDISGLRNLAFVRNPQVRILRKEDIDEWNNIIVVMTNIASIDFSKTAESEQALRLIGCRTKLVSNIEKKTSTIFDQISSRLLLLLNSQIAILRHNPELDISVVGEDITATQTILWENDNRNGKLYAVISNIGGSDCKQVSLVSYVNMKRVSESWINAVYVGEKIPFTQIFNVEDLVDGVVTWDIELSYFDDEKNQTIVVAHKTTAVVQIGGEPLNHGQISTGNPALGSNFIGRNRELALLKNHYSDINEIPSLLIRGLRRSGKSSILLRLAEDLRKKNNILIASVDGQSIAGNIKSAFIDKVLDSVRINYRNHPDYAEILNRQFTVFEDEWRRLPASVNWIEKLDIFYYELSQLFGKKLLIMVDEMESIFYSNRFSSAPEEEALYSALRSLIQKRENYVSFVFCGSDKLLTSCLEQRRESQIFQTLQFVEIGQMNNTDIREIFRIQSEKFDVKFTSDAVDTIWQYTHGLVWYAKLLGYIVINNILENDLTIRPYINRNDISNAVQMLINGEIGTDKYDLVDASLNVERSAIVHAMAGIMPDCNKSITVDEISTALKFMQIEGYTDPRTGELVTAMNEKAIKHNLQFLERMQLIVSNASRTKYSFAAELYRLFFRKEKKLHVFEERR